MAKRRTPVEYVIQAFGGAPRLASILHMTPQAIYRWAGKESGLIPADKHALILAEAKKRKIDVTPEDLILGRK